MMIFEQRNLRATNALVVASCTCSEVARSRFDIALPARHRKGLRRSNRKRISDGHPKLAIEGHLETGKRIELRGTGSRLKGYNLSRHRQCLE